MSLTDIRELISGVGFPVFVALFLLIWMRRSIDNNTLAITKLVAVIEKLCEHMGVKPPDK